jgi:hypothetical protein
MTTRHKWSVVLQRDGYAVHAVDFSTRRAALTYSAELRSAAVRGDYCEMADDVE